MLQSSRAHGASPAEERAASRREGFLAAALNIVGTSGIGGLGVRALCRESHLNSRYFYEEFEGLEELVGALHDQLVQELESRVLLRLTNTEDSQVVRAVLAETFRYLGEDPRRAAVMMADVAAGNVLAGRRRALLERIYQLFTVVQAPEGSVTDQAVLSAMLAGAFAELGLAWSTGRLGDDVDIVAERVERVFVSMLATADLAGVRRSALEMIGRESSER